MHFLSLFILSYHRHLSYFSTILCFNHPTSDISLCFVRLLDNCLQQTPQTKHVVSVEAHPADVDVTDVVHPWAILQH